MNWSYWEKSSFGGYRDVIIIGAGITGLSAAIALKISNPELRVLVLERGVLPSGASTKNAGFACFGSLSELIADEETLGLDGVLSLVEKRWKGLELLRNNIGDDNLDFKSLGGYELFRETNQRLADKCIHALEKYNKALFHVFGKDVFKKDNRSIERFGLSDISVLIANKIEGQLDTGKMMKSLLEKCLAIGVEIRFGMSVKNIEDDRIECDNGLKYQAEQVIVCTNGFAKQLLDVPLKPARAQVMITKPIENLKIKGTFHYDEGYYYFRNIHDRLLIGGGRNVDYEEEETTEMVNTEKIQNAIKEIIDRHILPNQDYKIDYAWSGIMGVGHDKAPIVRRINKNTVIAVKLGGMGVAIGSLVGQEAAKIVIEN